MRSAEYDSAHTPTCTDYSTVFPQRDAQASISFATPRTRRLNEAGIHVLPAHAHPHYVAHGEVEIHLSSCGRMASQGSDRHTQ